MTIPPPDYREELDIIRIDPLVLERQRARYANRGISFLVILNGVAALILLASLTQLAPQVEDASKVVGAMLVFGSGALAALGSTFFAYLRRMPRMQAPDRVPVRSGLWWLSLLGAVAGATCFLVGLNMAGRAVTPELETKATLSSEPPQTTVRQRKANKAVIRSLQQRLKDRNASERAKKREERKSSGDEPATKDERDSDTATPPPAAEPVAPPRLKPRARHRRNRRSARGRNHDSACGYTTPEIRRPDESDRRGRNGSPAVNAGQVQKLERKRERLRLVAAAFNASRGGRVGLLG